MRAGATPAGRRHRTWSGALFAVLALCVAGCSPKATSTPPVEPTPPGAPITVLAAASLTEPFETLATRFEAAHPGTTVELTFGSSATLATQLSQGAPADVFASASVKAMDSVATQVQDPVLFARNSMAIAVPAANPGSVTGVADLARPEVTVAVCQASAPCGAAAATVFANAGITVHPVTEEADVKATLTKVHLGEVDAGIVYVTDVIAGTDPAVRMIEIPAAVNASTEYPIAVVANSHHRDTAAQFVAFVTGPDGTAVLTAAGFQTVDGSPSTQP